MLLVYNNRMKMNSRKNWCRCRRHRCYYRCRFLILLLLHTDNIFILSIIMLHIFSLDISISFDMQTQIHWQSGRRLDTKIVIYYQQSQHSRPSPFCFVSYPLAPFISDGIIDKMLKRICDISLISFGLLNRIWPLSFLEIHFRNRINTT